MSATWRCDASAAGDDHGTFAFIQKNCVGCHNASVSSGGVDFSSLQKPGTFVQNREIWEHALAKLKAGEMPPPGAPKPPATAISATTQFLETEFKQQDSNIQADVGRVGARRLNKAEYNNTVRDLLGVDIEPAAEFPVDQAAYGFDNISDALGIS
jgi:hypothetical protein